MREKRLKIFITVLLLVACTGILVIFRLYYAFDRVFTHFFYLPVIVMAYWFGIKGIIPGIYLSLLVGFGPFIEGKDWFQWEDTARAMVLLGTSMTVSRISQLVMAQQKKIQLSEAFYRTLFENTGTAIAISDEATNIIMVNREFEELARIPRSHIEGKMSFKEFFIGEDLEGLLEKHHWRYSRTNNSPIIAEAKFVDGDGVVKDVLIVSELIKGTDKCVISIQDLTPIKALKRDKEALDKRLQEALEKVLSGLIPICAHCKKIRDEKGEWRPVEVYIKEKSDASFTHGICPECKERLYGRFLAQSPGEKVEKG